jgi:hypothetical protein
MTAHKTQSDKLNNNETSWTGFIEEPLWPEKKHSMSWD